MTRQPGQNRTSQRTIPPLPSVEDEAISLAREYGTSIVSFPAEEPQSRGDVDQNPMLMEVHEHNPERRFVIVLNSDKGSDAGPDDDFQNQRNETSPKIDLSEPVNEKRHRRNSMTRLADKQELPRLDTDMGADRTPAHHRSKSTASATRPDFFSQTQPRPYGDPLLSPEVTKHGPNSRDKRYYGHGRAPSDVPKPPTRTTQPAANERSSDDRRNRHSLAPSALGRSQTVVETGRSTDWDSEHRLRDETPSPRKDVKEGPVRNRRQDWNESGKAASAHGSREHSRHVGRTPVIVDDEREQAGNSESLNGNDWRARSPSRTRTMPVSAKSDFISEGTPLNYYNQMPPNPADEYDVITHDRLKPHLPYPDDDDVIASWDGVQQGSGHDTHLYTQPIPTVVMPHISPLASGLTAANNTRVGAPPIAATNAPQSWQPHIFDLKRDGIRLDNPIGSFRRYSENIDGGQPQLPDCRRTEPVTGKMDWLTLPRTDFNICPDCYGSVFADTEYRTHFQPMLRPTGSPIACDFGSSPWYRIAWLLTLKSRKTDLHIFHQVANVMSTSRNQPCPVDRKATRNWLTVRDPCTKRPVPDFTVCYQCARTVEALLPNLTGIFVPVDSRSEPTRAICALHFTSERREFVLYFDTFETTSDKALTANQPPNVANLATDLRSFSITNECREDRPISDGYWHIMQFLPQFTVCEECFNDTVRPQLMEDSVIARNFYKEPRKLAVATCQLYSQRMREIFKKACRRNDPKYLEDKVLERMSIEQDIHGRLVKLDRSGHDDAWTDEQVEKLIREWKKWE